MIRARDLVADIEFSDNPTPSNGDIDIERVSVNNDPIGCAEGYLGERQCIDANASIIDALKLMADRDVDALLVLEGNRLVGVVTEGDYTRNIILKQRQTEVARVADVMVPPKATVDAQTSAEDCMDILNQHSARYLPVTRGDQVLGLITIADVTRALIGDRDRNIRDLEHYIIANSQIN